MMNPQRNLFQAAHGETGNGEHFDTLFESEGARIERIASHGSVSDDGFWYDQPADEWVTLLRGSAALEYENAPTVELHEGDWLVIPRHVRHRVARTSSDALWLAVHVK